MTGLYHKYNVTKADGSPIDGEYFVLKFDDPYAKAALQVYAQVVESENPRLSKDIYDRVGNDIFTYAVMVDTVIDKLKEIIKRFEG
jgi:hypothetical protein